MSPLLASRAPYAQLPDAVRQGVQTTNITTLTSHRVREGARVLSGGNFDVFVIPKWMLTRDQHRITVCFWRSLAIYGSLWHSLRENI